MPFSYVEMMTELGYKEYAELPDFDVPTRVPLRRPLSESTVAVLSTCGAYLPDQERFGETNDLSYRLLPREVPTSEVLFAHMSPIRVWAEQDLNVAYPRDRMVELEAEGLFNRLAPHAVSILGSITTYSDLVQETVPKIKGELDAMGVDLVVLFPFCPACHRATCVVARALEARGIPTVTMTLLREMGEAFKPPRVAFLDFPLGCTAGKPWEPGLQRDILRTVLEAVPRLDGETWGVLDLPFQWAADGSRAWEDGVRRIYRERGRQTHSAHVAEHTEHGEKLVGREREFTISCAC